MVSVDRGRGFFVSQDKFLDFMKMPSSNQCLEYKVNIKYTDEKLKNEILRIYNKPELIKSLPKEKEIM